MATAVWTASTAFSVGDVRRPTVSYGTGLWFRCIQAGTSGTSEPTWPTELLRYDSSVDVAVDAEVAANCLFLFDGKCVAAGAVKDNTVVWAAISAVYDELLKLAPSAVIELFELRLDSSLHGSSDVYRFHAGMSRNDRNQDVNVVFNGAEYTRLPIKAEGFEYTSTGTLPRPTLTVSNMDSTMTVLLALVNETTAGNDLGGAEVRRIRTLKKYLDDINFRFENIAVTQGGDMLTTQSGDSLNPETVGNPSGVPDPHAQFPQERWFIDRKASESRDTVTFELASKFDLAGQKLPKRQVIANVCQWIYKSTECGYNPSTGPGKTIDGTNFRRFDVNNEGVTTDAEDVCGKRVASCKCRFGDNAELPFGSFPGAGLTK
jgi:phage-related protein